MSFQIDSSFICFGTVKYGALKPSVLNYHDIVVYVHDVTGAQRLCIQIAFKHICKVLVGPLHCVSMGEALQIVRV